MNLLGRYLIGEEWEQMPSYLEIAHPENVKTTEPEQTNEDAKAHVYSIFGVSPPERG